MKTLEAFCKARGYQGGHIFMMLEEISKLDINTNSTPYKWGVREAKALRYGWNIASYNVPVNSWEDNQSTLEYIRGLHDTLEAEFKLVEFGADNDSAVDARV